MQPHWGWRPKAPQEGTRGGWADGCRLWGFDGAAAWVGDALAGVVGGGSRITVTSLSLRRRSTGRFWPDRRRSRGLSSRGTENLGKGKSGEPARFWRRAAN